MDPYQLHYFLFQCCFYFCSGPTAFNLDFDKINFAMTYVSGVIQDWLQVALEQENQGIHHMWLYSWPSFVKEMYTYFGIPDIVAEVAHSLDHLHMDSDNQIATYNVAFLWYSAELQWTENALCYRYYFGLPDRIQDIISTYEEGKSSTFQTLYSTVISINNYFWEQKHESERASQCSLYPEYSEFVSNISLSDPSSNGEASESSGKLPTRRHILSLDISDSFSKLLLSVFNSGSIVSELSTSALLQTPSLELSDSASLSSSTSSSDPGILESPVKLESLVNLLSGLSNNLSSESLF